MPALQLIPASVSFSVHFMESTIPDLEETSQRLQRRAIEAIQKRAWGNRHKAFKDLMHSPAFNPEIPLDRRHRVPMADGLRRAALDAVKAWNLRKFPVRFREDWESITPAGTFAPASLAPLTSGTTPGDPTSDPWSCVVWEWHDGEYVPSYNYRVEPESGEPEDGHEGGAHAMAEMSAHDSLPSVFDDILPGVDLLAVYEFHVRMRLRFPMPRSMPVPASGGGLLPHPHSK